MINRMMNPRVMINQMMNDPRRAKNPRAQRVMEALNNNDHNQLVELGDNIFKENGTTLEKATSAFFGRMN